MSSSVNIAQLIYGGGYNGSYAEGAPVTTNGKPLYDGNIDKLDSSSASKVRTQTHWLNVNNTDIPTMVASATAKTIGISVNTQVESPSKVFNEQSETLIEEHNRIGVGELTNKFHFNGALRAISNFDLLDGGIIVRHHYNTEWAIPYKYELVGVDMIDTSKHTRYLDNKPRTTAGLVFNKWNQITHVWIYTDENKRKSEKVPYDNLTYYSEVWASIGQQVAISKLASILPTLDQVDQYGKAELESAIEEAKAGAYLKSTAYNEIMKIAFEKIDKLNDFDKQVVEFKTILQQLAKIGVGQYGLSPIPADDTVEWNNSKRDGIYKDLNSNSEMKMASSLGYSDIGVYSKASEANYSSIKYIMENDKMTASIRFDNISNIIVNEINTRLIQVGIQIGRITERVAYWKNPAKFNKFRYLRQNDLQIEPTKTAQANKINLGLGLTTEARIVETTLGIKYETFLEKKAIQDDLKFDAELKLEISQATKRKKAYEDAGLEIPEEDTIKKEEAQWEHNKSKIN